MSGPEMVPFGQLKGAYFASKPNDPTGEEGAKKALADAVHEADQFLTSAPIRPDGKVKTYESQKYNPETGKLEKAAISTNETIMGTFIGSMQQHWNDAAAEGSPKKQVDTVK